MVTDKKKQHHEAPPLTKESVPAPAFVKELIKNTNTNPEVQGEIAPVLTPEQAAKVETTRAELEAQAGVLETRTHDEIVDATVKAEEEAAVKRAEQMSPADMSSQFWMQFWPMYQANIATLSNKECKRVLEAIVQWPLEDEKPHFSSKEGRNAFALGTRLIDSKTIMRDTIELEMLNKQALAAEQANNAEMEYKKEEGEVKNG